MLVKIKSATAEPHKSFSPKHTVTVAKMSYSGHNRGNQGNAVDVPKTAVFKG